MWPVVWQTLGGVNVISVFVRLFMAVVFGGVIGLDRGRKRRAAGFRTYMLVCMGAALVMLTNQYICETFKLSDPARLGAQVISGIGFLGAGTIIVTRQHQVIGLTTAAGLWACACMGLAIGIGFYIGAILGCFFIIFIIVLLHSLDNFVVSNSRVMEVYIELAEEGGLSDFLSYVANHSIKVTYIEIIKAGVLEQKSVAALITMRLPKRHSHPDVVKGLARVDCIRFIEEV